jgi:anti-anti-sigma regulatory factor
MTISVEGELDAASLDVLQSVALQALELSSARVELDLRDVSFSGVETIEMSSSVSDRARALNRPFLLTTPTPRRQPGAPPPRTRP